MRRVGAREHGREGVETNGGASRMRARLSPCFLSSSSNKSLFSTANVVKYKKYENIKNIKKHKNYEKYEKYIKKI